MIYVFLRICVCALCNGILASRVLVPTGTPYVNCTNTLWMSGDPNWVFPIGICGRGDKQIYPLGRIPTDNNYTKDSLFLNTTLRTSVVDLIKQNK